MNQRTPHLFVNKPLPLYIRLWNQLKRFPKALYKGSQNPPTTSGSAAAFLISGGIGAVVMMVAHHLSDTSKAREAALHRLGSWIPGSANPDPMWGNIGSYAGKETILLIGWLGSLVILYPILKTKQIKSRTLFFWMFSLFTLATLMSWHPLFPYLPLQ
ncbi:MAG: hypothetical protein KME10_00610 [Plectolyngbya sp. WJT66-NPBG17]|jgi:hypothetical protein|nr:hypothetical protein [Plectolyngbya sp. WJT66-NPBG17]MBW4523681.1 hypothetical protein [Phormidium tanganyikae FI6-MK23]